MKAVHDGPAPGAVWLVGAGPGDPGLLTLRAAGALRSADVIFHDALPGREVLRLANPEARLVNVGKRKGHAPWPQSRINAALVEAAREGRRVVRLKGGDPLLFGRGGEELLALTNADITVEIVPGVSSASAAAAAFQIPLTHRGKASAVSFVTGHDMDGTLPSSVDWDALARTGGTIVLFMALTRIDEIALRLLGAGMAAETPVAILARASLPGQAELRTTLGRCTLDSRRADLPSPALLLIGAVAALAKTQVVKPHDHEQEPRHVGA